MATPEYAEAIKHMTDCANICFKINTTAPLPEQIRHVAAISVENWQFATSSVIFLPNPALKSIELTNFAHYLRMMPDGQRLCCLGDEPYNPLCN